MKVLIDTHILLWIFFEPTKLTKRQKDTLTDGGNEVYYSPFSLWEIMLKYEADKLDLGGLDPFSFFQEVSDSFIKCFEILPNTLASGYQLAKLTTDPFDRILVWEALKHGMPLMSCDAAIVRYEQEGLTVI